MDTNGYIYGYEFMDEGSNQNQILIRYGEKQNPPPLVSLMSFSGFFKLVTTMRALFGV
jgi:hypothetical protein